MSIQLSLNEIKNTLNSLGIKHRGQPNHKGWLSVICPNHNATSFSTCSINIMSNRFKCWSCGYSESLFTYVMSYRGLSFKEALKFIKGSDVYVPNNTPIYIEKKEPKFESKYFDKQKNKYNFLSLQIDPNKFFYTKQRGFTEEFCKTFGIEHVLSFPYSDYYCIPIIDTEREIYTFEFRKLMEYEYLKKRYNSEAPFKRLKNTFTNECDENKIVLDNYKLYKDGVEITDSNLMYLLEPKVKYEKNSTLKLTLWNIDNLKFNEPLYLVEGIGSVCKIWSNISKNVTCTFGSKLTREQLDILKLFKKVIVVPDNDDAGKLMIRDLGTELKDSLYIIDVKQEDTDIEYVTKIKSSIEISYLEFFNENTLNILTNKYKLFFKKV